MVGLLPQTPLGKLRALPLTSTGGSLGVFELRASSPAVEV